MKELDFQQLNIVYVEHDKVWSLCPYHKDINRPNLSISLLDRYYGRWKCWACNRSGLLSKEQMGRLNLSSLTGVYKNNSKSLLTRWKLFTESCCDNLKKFPLLKLGLAKELNISTKNLDEWLVGFDGCLTKGHKVLTSKFSWVDVSTLQKGDELATFEEMPRSKKKKRRWAKAVVLNNVPIIRPVYKLYLSDGTSIEASGEHPFLVVREAHNRSKRWKTVKELFDGFQYNKSKGKNTYTFNRAIPVYKNSLLSDFELGWLSGLYDGEGCIHQSRGKSKRGTSNVLSLSQNKGMVLEKAEQLLQKLNIKYYKYHRLDNTYSLVISKTNDVIWLLSILQPIHLLNNLKLDTMGSFLIDYPETPLKIINIKFIGNMTVRGLSTTTKTYISEGFLCHNSSFTIPMFREDLTEYNLDKGFCGVQRRFPDGSKRCVTGSRLGLMYPYNYIGDYYIFICEGFSDAISVWDLGLQSIARPHCRHTDGIEGLFNYILGDVERIIIIPDNDTVGMEGAIELRSILEGVCYGEDEWPCDCEIFSFDGAKDIRKLIQLRGKDYVRQNLGKYL